MPDEFPHDVDEDVVIKQMQSFPQTDNPAQIQVIKNQLNDIYETEVRPVLHSLCEHGTDSQPITVSSDLSSDIDPTDPILSFVSAITGLVNSELSDSRVKKEIDKQKVFFIFLEFKRYNKIKR